MCGWWVASRAKPFEKALRRRALTASACWIIFASVSNAMSMAVVGFCFALDVSAKHLGGYMAHELGVAEIRSFLDTAKTSDSLEHKLYKVGSLIFAYGKEQRVLVLNPFDDIDRPEMAYTVPEILEPAKFKKLLETAEEEVPE